MSAQLNGIGDFNRHAVETVIRRARKSGLSGDEIARCFGTDRRTLAAVLEGKIKPPKIVGKRLHFAAVADSLPPPPDSHTAPAGPAERAGANGQTAPAVDERPAGFGLRHYIELLHDRAKAAGIDGKLVVAAFGEDPASGRKLPAIVEHFAIGDIDGMAECVRELSEERGRNVYVPPAVMRPDLPARTKGGEADIVSVLGLVADFDDDDAANWQTRMPVEPSFVLETSPGRFQAFAIFDQPLPPAEAKPLAKALKTHAKCDHGTADIAHVWRMPGTRNWPSKTKIEAGRSPEPAPVQVAVPFDGRLVSAGDLRNALADTLAVVEREATPADTKAIESGIDWARAEAPTSYDEIPADLRQRFGAACGHDPQLAALWRGDPEGLVGQDASGSGFDFSLACRLKEHGFDATDFATLVRIAGWSRANDLNRYKVALAWAKAGQRATPPADDFGPPAGAFMEPVRALTPRDLRRRPWVFGHLLQRETISALVAPPGASKSTFVLAAAVSIATGRDLLGIPVVERTRVALWNNEDSRDELDRRLAAILWHFHIPWSAIEGRLFIQTGDRRPFRIAKRTTRNGVEMIAPKDLNEARDFLKANDIGVFIADPLRQTHPVEENSNDQMAAIGELYRQLAQQSGAAVWLVHHTRKPDKAQADNMAGDMDTGRGASALVGDIRQGATLYTMTAGEARRYGVAEADRHRYVRLDEGKANMTLLHGKPRWFERVGVDVPVAVAREWADFTDEQGNAFAQENVGILAPIDLREPTDRARVEAALLIQEVAALVADGPLTANDIATRLVAENEIYAGRSVEWLAKTIKDRVKAGDAVCTAGMLKGRKQTLPGKPSQPFVIWLECSDETDAIDESE